MFKHIATFVSGDRECSTGGGLSAEPQVAIAHLRDELTEGAKLGFKIKRGVIEEQRNGHPFLSHIMPSQFHPVVEN